MHRPLRAILSLPRHIAPFIILLLGVELAGCSTTTLPAGAALGHSGKDAATAMRQAALVSPAELNRLMISDAFLMAFYGNPAPAAIVTRHATVAKLQKELASRAAVLGNLADSYDALASLASYDASGSFNTALGGLVGSTNAYLKGAGLNTIPPNDSALIPLVGGLLASTIQQQMVRDASAKIRPRLADVIAAMEKYQSEFVNFRKAVVDQGGDAAIVLSGSGLFSAVPALNAIGSPYGYTAIGSADRILANPKFQQARLGLAAVQAAQAQQQVTLVATTFDQSLSLLRRLQAQHVALENSQPTDLAGIATELGALQATINQLQAALALK